MSMEKYAIVKKMFVFSSFMPCINGFRIEGGYRVYDKSCGLNTIDVEYLQYMKINMKSKH